MTGANVTSLHGGPTMTKEPNADAIEVLRDALERAISGEVVGVGIVMSEYDGTACFSVGGMVGGYSDLGAAYTLARVIQESAL